jgi:hypothetical protein
MQKTANHGNGETRYFWNVTSVAPTGEKSSGVYRSRSAKLESVKTTFKLNGHKNVRVTAARA